MPWRDLDGILLLDKPLGLSSSQALQVARRLLGAAKGGHTGALDPLATGLLPLCFGEATKLAGHLLGARKAYLAECRLGITTTTADREGEVAAEQPVPDFDEAVLETALAKLRGRIMQVPPVYSALKQGGEPLYRKARRGETVAVAPRAVDIHRLDLLERAGDTLRLYVECGGGTYIRSLAVALGEALGCGAHLAGLRRLWVEPFTAPAMITLERLAEAAARGEAESLLLPLAAGVAHWPALRLDAALAQAVRHGRPLAWPGADDARGPHAAFDEDGRLLALVERRADGRLGILRGLRPAAGS